MTLDAQHSAPADEGGAKYPGDRPVICGWCNRSHMLHTLRMVHVPSVVRDHLARPGVTGPSTRTVCEGCRATLKRIAIEARIIRRLCVEARAAGFIPFEVYDGGEYLECTTNADVLAVVFSVDDATVSFRTAGQPDDVMGVLLVLGNSGWDVITDYNTDGGPFDAMMARVEAYAETFDV